MFNGCVTKLLEERTNYSMQEVLRLHASLLNYALQSYPGNLDYVNHCLGQCAAVLAKRGEEVSEREQAEAEADDQFPTASSHLCTHTHKHNSTSCSRRRSTRSASR
jgi:hypothetical protein